MHHQWHVLTLGCLMLLSWPLPAVSSLPELEASTLNAALDRGTPLLVLVYSKECSDCQQAEAAVEDMFSQGEVTQLIPGVQVFKQQKGGPLQVAARVVKSFPALILLRGGVVALYTDKFDNSDSLFFWLEKAGPTPLTQVLTDDTFEHLTQASTGSTTGHWAVLFYRASCQDHQHLLESVGVNEKLWMNVATVDLDTNPKLSKRFKPTSCPELIYFREGKMYRYETQKYDIPSLTSFVKTWYRNVKGSVVPTEPTAFDALTENIAMYIKAQMEGENRNFFLAISGGIVAMVVITSIFCCLTGGSDSKQKED